MTKVFLAFILIFSFLTIFSQDKKINTDSLKTLNPTFQYKKLTINWPLTGFKYKNSAIWYDDYILSYNTLREIAQLEPNSIKKQVLIKTLSKAKSQGRTHAAIVLPSIFLTSYGLISFLAAGMTLEDKTNLLRAGTVLTSAGIVGLVISGRIHSKKNKTNRLLVDLLNN
jgi:hypothetical protein